ncbi:MAG TPA: hypothetical protein VJM32_04025 [Candidatus Saccharimonadales bacterium]|nr:hypothetical protein [Candidatus Saccharimonadales bacterium]
MGRNTPQMNNVQLKDYLESHLNGELQWLLRAATEWHAQKQLNLRVGGYHAQVYAMDSAFLHARTLFEFFTKNTSDNYYAVDAYGLAPIQSPLYTNNWVGVLHGYLMHAQDRSSPRQLTSFDGSTSRDLNQMPTDFAREVVRLWTEFCKELASSSDSNISALEPIARRILQEATNNAAAVLNRKSVHELGMSAVTAIVW